MVAYIFRRLLLMVPTLLGIFTITFLIIQFVPGGPVEQVIAQLQGFDASGADRLGGSSSDLNQEFQQGGNESGGSETKYRGAQGLPPEFIEKLEKQFGLDKPAYERYFLTLADYLSFEFGESFFQRRPVIDLIIERLPVSISLGIWIMLISYLISIPMGILKATHDGTRLDFWTSAIIIVGYAIPGFLFAILLLILFAGGSFLDLFPLRGLVATSASELPQFIQNMYPDMEPYDDPATYLPWYWRVVDYFWHLTLPIAAMVISQFAILTLLTKNSFMDEIGKQYVITARAKGLTERGVLYGHIFRNAMLIIISGFPGAFIGAFFAGSLLIEFIFSLEGFGQLSYDAIFQRDYPIVMANLYIFGLIGLLVNLVSDLTYTWIDPRINFESKQV